MGIEIGFGTSHCLEELAEAVGETGKVHGIDLSSGMLAVSRRRLEKPGCRVRLNCSVTMRSKCLTVISNSTPF